MAAANQYCIAPSTHRTLPRWFRVNQIPALRNIVWKKDELCKTLDTSIEAAVAALGPDVRAGLARHVIPCWLYPMQEQSLAQYFANGGGIVIVKPTMRGEGRGIYTAKTLAEIETQEKDRNHRYLFPEPMRVVQRMELAPALLWGRKFDLRTYATPRHAALRHATQRDSTQRNATQRCMSHHTTPRHATPRNSTATAHDLHLLVVHIVLAPLHSVHSLQFCVFLCETTPSPPPASSQHTTSCHNHHHH